MLEIEKRINFFRAEITKMLLSFNKPIQRPLVDQKAELMAETLEALPTDKIKDFFKYIRTNEDSMPSDGVLRKILSNNHKKFTNYTEEAQIEYKGEYPDEAWRKRFTNQVNRVINGEITSDEAKAEMGLI